jgi:2-oxo-3-hexenedioate decarboxylase/2-keto-4-pentenoate hydratase
MFSAAAAARFIDEAHRTRAVYRNLPGDIAPGTVAEAYAAQEALAGLWEKRLGPVAGRKIATTTRIMQELMGIDHPCGGLIFASRIFHSPAFVRKDDYVNMRIECELAVRLGRDLPKQAEPYSRETARAAISEVMAAFELIEDRKAEYKTTSALSLIADNAWNGGIVIGPGMQLPAGLDLDGIAGTLQRDGKPAGTGRTDDPLGALAWLANLAADRGRPLTAGMVVITGSVITTLDIAPGERLDLALDGVGAASMTATR